MNQMIFDVQTPGDPRSQEPTENNPLHHIRYQEHSNSVDSKIKDFAGQLRIENPSLSTAGLREVDLFERHKKYHREFKTKRRIFKRANENRFTDILKSSTKDIYSSANDPSSDVREENVLFRRPKWAANLIEYSKPLRTVRNDVSVKDSCLGKERRAIRKTGKAKAVLEPANQPESSTFSNFGAADLFVCRTPARRPRKYKLEHRLARNRFKDDRISQVNKLCYFPLPLPLAPLSPYSNDSEARQFVFKITDSKSSPRRMFKSFHFQERQTYG